MRKPVLYPLQTYLLPVVLLLTCCCFGQKTDEYYSPAQYKSTTCKSWFGRITLAGENNTATIEQLLKNTNENLKDSRCGLKLNYRNTSIGGYHYSFTQTFSGIPVYQSEIKVNTDKSNVIHSIFDNSYYTRNWNLNTANAGDDAVIAMDPASGNPVIAKLSILKHSLETLTSTGTIIFQQDLNCYYRAPDSLVSGKVFNPDPLTTAGHVYDTATIYHSLQASFDGPWLDAPWLDAQEQVKSFRANFTGTLFTLESPYVKVVSFDTFSPNIPPVTSAIPQFYFNRSESGFVDVNAFYHISAYHDYIKHLGFDCADSLIAIDTHAIPDDNSFFAPGYYPHEIYYGIGGVPDAEDADVVVHEYCHSVSFTAAPNSNVGLERRGLDEAFCDYNAGSYSKSLNTFNDQWVYNWDGHNQFWPGRVVNSAKVYPADLDGSIYHNGEIWSAALFSLNGDIGRGATDSLLIQAHYSYAQNISMADAALLLVDADSLLFNGSHYCNIYQRLLEHGFAVPNRSCSGTTGIQESKTAEVELRQNGNSFTIFSGGNSRLRLQIFDLAGRQVANVTDEYRSVFIYQNQALPSGLYLVNVISDNSADTFKWVNAK